MSRNCRYRDNCYTRDVNGGVCGVDCGIYIEAIPVRTPPRRSCGEWPVADAVPMLRADELDYDGTACERISCGGEWPEFTPTPPRDESELLTAARTMAELFGAWSRSLDNDADPRTEPVRWGRLLDAHKELDALIARAGEPVLLAAARALIDAYDAWEAGKSVGWHDFEAKFEGFRAVVARAKGGAK